MIVAIYHYYKWIKIMTILGILGKKRHGKDTISNHIISKYNFQSIAYAGPLKEMCRILFGFNDEQLYGNDKEIHDKYWKITPRDAFQYVGTDLIRKQMNGLIPGIKESFWVECTKISILKRLNENPSTNIVVTDVRFADEVDLIHELGGYIIKVERPSINSSDEHISEKGIDDINNYDHKIINDSTLEELYKKVDTIVSSF